MIKSLRPSHASVVDFIEHARHAISTADVPTDSGKETLHATLNNHVDDLQTLYANYEETHTQDRLTRMQARFPTNQDPTATPTPITDYEHLTEAVLTAWYIEDTLDTYRTELNRDVTALQHHLADTDEPTGHPLFDFLYANGARKYTRDKTATILTDQLDNAEMELEAYNNESDAYDDRNISQQGLITYDAIKCLHDFDGRTFPFLRATTQQITPNDTVLELGTGTGILAIAATLAQATAVTGVEINPITTLLARRIRNDLVTKGIIPPDTFTIKWGDALSFATIEHQADAQTTFDALITENIYTGMFHELQMDIVKHALNAGILPTHYTSQYGYHHTKTDATVIPASLSSTVQPVQLTTPTTTINTPTNVLHDARQNNTDIDTHIASPRTYDIIDFTTHEPQNILANIRYTPTQDARIDAIKLYSTIRLTNGDYIDHTQNEFLNNPSLIYLNEPVTATKNDDIILSIAYNGGDPIEQSIIELYHTTNANLPHDTPAAHLNVPDRTHEQNKLTYKRTNNIRQPLPLGHLGNNETLRSTTFINGNAHLWMADQTTN